MFMLNFAPSVELKSTNNLIIYRFVKNNTTDIIHSYNKVIKSFNISHHDLKFYSWQKQKHFIIININSNSGVWHAQQHKRVVPSRTIQGPNSQLLAPYIWPLATNTCGALPPPPLTHSLVHMQPPSLQNPPLLPSCTQTLRHSCVRKQSSAMVQVLQRGIDFGLV
jgi:hypothetical protein